MRYIRAVPLILGLLGSLPPLLVVALNTLAELVLLPASTNNPGPESYYLGELLNFPYLLPLLAVSIIGSTGAIASFFAPRAGGVLLLAAGVVTLPWFGASIVRTLNLNYLAWIGLFFFAATIALLEKSPTHMEGEQKVQGQL